MMNHWNLDVLYTGYEDPKFQGDYTLLEELIRDYNQFTASLSHENERLTLSALVEKQEKMEELTLRLMIYTMLRQSVCTTDNDTANYLGKQIGRAHV